LRRVQLAGGRWTKWACWALTRANISQILPRSPKMKILAPVKKFCAAKFFKKKSMRSRDFFCSRRTKWACWVLTRANISQAPLRLPKMKNSCNSWNSCAVLCCCKRYPASRKKLWCVKKAHFFFASGDYGKTSTPRSVAL
jgi:hypothetical protein